MDQSSRSAVAYETVHPAYMSTPTRMAPDRTLFRDEILPFVGSLLALLLATLVLDAALHFADAVWIGRYLGIPGVMLILASSRYSLRKRKLIASRQPATLLRQHEHYAWAGSVLVLVHAGIHFNSWLAWIATAAMLINVISGLTGKFLLARALKHLGRVRRGMLDEGASEADIAEATHWDSLTVNAIKQWRVIHIPITLGFAGLALAHIIAIFLFWNWS